MSYTIYALRHKATGRFYIGSTDRFEHRMVQWRRAFERTAAFCGNGGWRPGTEITRKLFETSRTWEDYAPIIMEMLPVEATADDAAMAENRAIAWAAATVPELVLNSFACTFRDGAVSYHSYRIKTGQIRPSGPRGATSPSGGSQVSGNRETAPEAA